MTMDVFALRNAVVGDYERFVAGFLNVRDDKIRGTIDATLADGLLWPEPWFSLNPRFSPGGRIDELVALGLLEAGCSTAFRMDKAAGQAGSGQPLSLYRHQVEAIEAARGGYRTKRLILQR
jgi:hypothetical protein